VLALVAGRTGPGQGCPGLRESRKALPDPVFVGCQQGFNKRLIGQFREHRTGSEKTCFKSIL
jgi:hypothetical protein